MTPPRRADAGAKLRIGYLSADYHTHATPLLLAEVLHAITADHGGAMQAGQIKAAKFLHPVRPGDTVIIDYVRTAGGMLQFECAVGQNKVLTGSAHAADA